MSSEKQMVKELGGEIVAWGPDSLVIQYRSEEQKAQLKKRLAEFGWLCTAPDDGDDEAMLLDLRRTPDIHKTSDQEILIDVNNNVTLNFTNARATYIVVAVLVSVLAVAGYFGVQQDLSRHDTQHALLTVAMTTVLGVVLLVSGLWTASSKITFGHSAIALSNIFRTVTLAATDIKQLNVESRASRGGSAPVFCFKMKSGSTVKRGAVWKTKTPILNEIKRRYKFPVHGG